MQRHAGLLLEAAGCSVEQRYLLPSSFFTLLPCLLRHSPPSKHRGLQLAATVFFPFLTGAFWSVCLCNGSSLSRSRGVHSLVFGDTHDNDLGKEDKEKSYCSLMLNRRDQGKQMCILGTAFRTYKGVAVQMRCKGSQGGFCALRLYRSCI